MNDPPRAAGGRVSYKAAPRGLQEGSGEGRGSSGAFKLQAGQAGQLSGRGWERPRRKEGAGRGLPGLPAATGAGRGKRPAPAQLPGPHSLVPLQEAALGDGPHGGPRGLGVHRGAEAQAQLLLQAAGQGREAVAARVGPSSGLRARVTVLLVLGAPGRLLELIEILPVPVRRHRARCRRAPRPGPGGHALSLSGHAPWCRPLGGHAPLSARYQFWGEES